MVYSLVKFLQYCCCKVKQNQKVQEQSVEVENSYKENFNVKESQPDQEMSEIPQIISFQQEELEDGEPKIELSKSKMKKKKKKQKMKKKEITNTLDQCFKGSGTVFKSETPNQLRVTPKFSEFTHSKTTKVRIHTPPPNSAQPVKGILKKRQVRK